MEENHIYMPLGSGLRVFDTCLTGHCYFYQGGRMWQGGGTQAGIGMATYQPPFLLRIFSLRVYIYKNRLELRVYTHPLIFLIKNNKCNNKINKYLQVLRANHLVSFITQ